MSPHEVDRWEPIAGVDLDTYAHLMAALLKDDAEGVEPSRYATAAGISPAQWAQARSGWTMRIADYDDVRDVYSGRYRVALMGVAS
jgi:hypothetical protein